MALFDSGLSLLIYGPGPVCLSPQGGEAEVEPDASVTDRRHFLTPFNSLRRGLWVSSGHWAWLKGIWPQTKQD